MRVGLVSPYSFDVPGGVQLHVQELAQHLIGKGHQVSVLAPAERSTDLPPYAVSAGRAVPVRYNGSVARLAFGPAVAARVGEWVDEHAFEVVHIHEPASPSVSLLALWAVSGPVVATFHSSQIKSRTLRLAGPVLQPGMDKISARIAVSRQARRTVEEQLGAGAIVIPNGVDVTRFATDGTGALPPAMPARGEGPCLLFLGRFAEPRKGLSVLLDALPLIQTSCPGVQVVVAGPGRSHEVGAELSERTAAAVHFVGPVTEAQKVSLLRGCDLYVAPNTGGESFGIILVEALSAGAPVVASDLLAFADVLDGERQRHGVLFPAGDHRGLAGRVVQLWRDPAQRSALARGGPRRAAHFDWSRVGPRIEAVYDSVRPVGGTVARHVPVRRRRWGRPR